MSAQPKEVMAFRARLLRWGYTDVSIERVSGASASDGELMGENWYLVQAVEPLAGQRIVFPCLPSAMRNLLRKTVTTLKKKRK